jgi:subtilase family serine protease
VRAELPAGTPGGPLRLRLVADPHGRVAESSEDDNAADLTVQVEAPRPNLDPTRPRAEPSRLEAGAETSVSTTVRNRGEGPAPATKVAFALVDARGRRTPLGEAPVPALAGGGEAPVVLRVRVPAATPPGRYALSALVDPARAIEPTDHDDDEATAPDAIEVVPAGPPPAPNLVPTEVKATPGVVRAGGSVVVEALVRNAGTGPSPASNAMVFLVGPDGRTTELGRFDLPGLAAGSEARFSGRVTVPATTPERRWALGVRVDPDRRLAQSDRNDDDVVAVGGLVVEAAPPARAELAVRAVELEGHATVDPAAPVAARVRVANGGAARAPAFDVALLLATRERPERRRDGWRGVVAELARIAVPAGLAPGAETLRRLEGRLPAGLGAGTYFLVAVADPAGQEPGTRPDLWGAVAVHVEARAVLRGLGEGLLVAPAEAFPGETVAVTGAVRNEGNAPLERATVVVRLLEQRRGGAEAQTALFRAALGTLRPGETREARLTVSAPPGLRRGRYRVVLRVEAPGWGPEDLLEGALSVRSKAPGVDLVAFDARVSPPRARAGERVRVAVSVANLGDGRSPATRVVVRDGEGRPGDARGPRGEADVPALEPGQTAEVVVPTRLPRDLAEGTTWLAATVDPERRIPQAERENDAAWVSVEVRGRHDRDVDLGLSGLAVDAEAFGGRPVPGRAFDVRARVHNRGRGRVEDADVEALLVGPGTAVRSLGRRPLGGAIAEGAETDWAERFVLPGDLPAGSYVLRLLLDPDARLPWGAGAEGAATEIPFVVGPSASAAGPDLAALALDPVPAPRAGSRTLSFTARVANRGSEPAGSFEASLGLEPGPEVAGDYPWRLPLATAIVAAGLRPGAETLVRFDAATPEFLADGDYVVTLVVDPRGVADRGRSDDNRLARALRLGDAPRPAPTPTPPAPTPPEPPAPERPTPPPGPAPAPAADVRFVDVRPVEPRVAAGAAVRLAWRLVSRDAPPGATFRLTVSARDDRGGYVEWMTSAPIPVPAPETEASGVLPVVPPAEASGRVHLRVVARSTGGGFVGSAQDSAETDVEIGPAAGTASPDPALPIPLAALLEGGALSRDRGDGVTFLLHYPADRRGGAVLEVVLEAGGKRHPLGEFDVPAGREGLAGVARGRLRAPESVAPGNAHLVLTIRDKAAGPRSDALRVPVQVR